MIISLYATYTGYLERFKEVKGWTELYQANTNQENQG